MRVLSFLFDLVRKLHKKGAMGFSLQFNTVKLEAKFLQVFLRTWDKSERFYNSLSINT